MAEAARREPFQTHDIDYLLFEEITVTKGSAPKFLLDGREVDLWDEPYAHYHSKSPVDYVRETILDYEKKGIDPFQDIVGKAKEKELVKVALFSGSPILFRGERGYGKTTFSKAIAKLLPERLLAVKGCKIYDDPTRPACFSCKEKVTHSETIELTWVPKIWVRIPGDPLLTTRQLIGGISIQKIREGYDLDHPEVFIPGRALKANRGVGYFDELGALPTSLQTLLHELFEEHQVTTSEGDPVPFKIQTLEVASTNPANYRGTSPIKEPLLDRMEEIEIGPPETLEEEMEIGRRNMYSARKLHRQTLMPEWHLKTLARTVRFGRDEKECAAARKIQSEPSCRATIKLFDHVESRSLRDGRSVPLLCDYGDDFEIVELALAGRIEAEYAAKDNKREIVRELLDEAIKRTCREMYERIPPESFGEFFTSVLQAAETRNGERYLPIGLDMVERLRASQTISTIMEKVVGDGGASDEYFLSALEMVLHSISVCAPDMASRSGRGYALKELVEKSGSDVT